MTLQGRGTFRWHIRSLPLLNGIYTVQSKIKNRTGAMVGGGTSLALFSVTVPRDQRISSDYGVVIDRRGVAPTRGARGQLTDMPPLNDRFAGATMPCFPHRAIGRGRPYMKGPGVFLTGGDNAGWARGRGPAPDRENP
jgi:hypothetical protein